LYTVSGGGLWGVGEVRETVVGGVGVRETLS